MTLNLRKIFALAAFAVITTCIPGGFYSFGAALTFEGTDPGRTAIRVDTESSTGLECTYVVSFTGTATAVFDAGTVTAAATTRWTRFTNLGGAFGTEVPSFSQGNLSKIVIQPDDCGYIIESNGRQYCFWVTNYRNHALLLTNLDVPSIQSECDRTELYFGGAAERIVYYSINGVGKTLSRQLRLIYSTLKYNEEKQYYENSQAEEMLEYASTNIRVPAPLCNTIFTLSGDRFLQAWGEEQHISSATYQTSSIGVETTAEQTSREVLNEQKDSKATLGGSGPVEITFSAATSDAVIYREWQFARNRDFDPIDLRIQDDIVVHNFTDYGTTYVQFVAANADNTCTYSSEVYDVYIGESKLECPNAFSPYGSPGVNDEWKVSYKSITEFDCHIFNRWGQEIIHLTDPAQGWDGKYKGKLVAAGVYYYVIKAHGTDGKDYKLSGDINILKYSSNHTTTTTN